MRCLGRAMRSSHFAVMVWVAGGVALGVFAGPDELLKQAMDAELAGKATEARQLWLGFLAAEGKGERADRVRHRLVVLGTKELGKDCRGYPVWSPDGKLIMYGYGGLAIVDVATGEQVSMEAPTGPMYYHDWSPDGITIACRQKLDSGRPAVFLYERQPDEALFPAGDGAPICQGVGARFDWSGRQLLVSQAAKEVNGKLVQFGIARYELATQKLLPIPWQHAKRTGRNHASWSGEERYVFHAYGRAAMADRAIFVARVSDGGGVVQITDNGASNYTPVVASDGSRLACSRAKKGEPEVLLLALTDGSLKPIEIGPGNQPCWSPDGSRLAYNTPQGVKIVRLGGVCSRLLGAAGVRKGDAISLTLVNDGEALQMAWLSCQVYDERSVRVADWSWEDDPLTVPAKESLTSDYPIPKELLANAAVARFRIQPAVGPAEIIMVSLEPTAGGQ
jgi:hypothetical protein